MDEIDRTIVNRLQQGFPLEREPFKAVACAIGISEQALHLDGENLASVPGARIGIIGGRCTFGAEPRRRSA